MSTISISLLVILLFRFDSGHAMNPIEVVVAGGAPL